MQYDPPEETLEYVHRVGRTARMGERGQAIIFLEPSELQYLEVLRKFHVCCLSIARALVSGATSVFGLVSGNTIHLFGCIWMQITLQPRNLRTLLDTLDLHLPEPTSSSAAAGNKTVKKGKRPVMSRTGGSKEAVPAGTLSR